MRAASRVPGSRSGKRASRSHAGAAAPGKMGWAGDPMSGEEQDLVFGAIRGEPLALDRLLLLHYPALAARVEKRIPRRLRALLAPEDIVQETFAEAFRTIGGVPPPGEDALPSWLLASPQPPPLPPLPAYPAAQPRRGA